MKKLLLVFLFFALGQGLYAQQDSTLTKPPNEKNYQIYTWDIGADLRPLLFYPSSSYIPGRISLRRNFSKIKQGGKVVYRANRLGLEIAYRNSESPYANLGNNFRVGITFGKEYQKPLGRFQFFYGADFTPILEIDRPVLANNPDNSPTHYYFAFNSSVFTGFKFFIHSRFMLSWEMAGYFYRNPYLVVAPNDPRGVMYGFDVRPMRTISFHFFL